MYSKALSVVVVRGPGPALLQDLQMLPATYKLLVVLAQGIRPKSKDLLQLGSHVWWSAHGQQRHNV